jgi:hypothetical protein
MRHLAIGAGAVLAGVVILIAAGWLYVAGGISGVLVSDLPDHGAPRLNTDYGADIDCLLQFRFGDAVWRLEQDDGWPPPEELPGIRDTFSTWTVPGIVRFTSPTEAVFRAQTDGSEWSAHPASGELVDGICI